MRTAYGHVPWALAAACLFLARGVAARPDWVEVRPGLDKVEVTGPDSGGGEVWSLVAIRADPARFDLVVLSAGARGRKGARTADEWARTHDLVLVANAGMYQQDGVTPVGHLRANGREVGRWRKDYRAVLVAGPEDPRRPAVALLDAACDGPLPAAARGYRHAVQGMRMWTCRGENTFRPGGRRAARLAAGVDGAGRLLLVFHRTPVTNHDFVGHVREAGLDARGLMYLEGGSEASLLALHPDGEVRAGGVGSSHLGKWTRLPEGVFLPIPNVIGLRPRR